MWKNFVFLVWIWFFQGNFLMGSRSMILSGRSWPILSDIHNYRRFPTRITHPYAAPLSHSDPYLPKNFSRKWRRNYKERILWEIGKSLFRSSDQLRPRRFFYRCRDRNEERKRWLYNCLNLRKSKENYLWKLLKRCTECWHIIVWIMNLFRKW